MDPRAVLRWLEAVSHAPPARRQRVIGAVVAASTLASLAIFEHNRKDNGFKRREAERVNRELLKHQH
jgi:hypothetical protein